MSSAPPDAASLRRIMIGLLAFAGAEDLALLAAEGRGEHGSPDRWAAAPLVAHNTEFKRQQVDRLAAITTGRIPAEYPEVDHGSAALYAGYAALPPDKVRRESSAVTAALIEAAAEADPADLTEPSRHPWLNGRMLWLQVIVRGFWHPTGHLIGYYLAHSDPGRAVGLAAHGVSTASYLGAPGPAQGMAYYNLACAQSRSGSASEALASLRAAVGCNPELRAKAPSDPDLVDLPGVREL